MPSDPADLRSSLSLPSWMDAAWLKKARGRVLRWYRANGRKLPWRETSDGYAVWVSEIMLQQTQVATVLPYYSRFLNRFPSVLSLAQASEDEVLRYWEGLGYYRRARQMHAAARRIAEEHAGEFPTEFESVRALPGIGRYTAGAILSFAYNKSYPIVEANTQRLYARLCLVEQTLIAKESQQKLWDFATAIVGGKEGGLVNQGLMELGAMICKPREPDCVACPLAELCETRRLGRQAFIPAPKAPKQYEERHELVALLQDGKGRWLVKRCEEGERWAGLWDFPRFDVTNCESPSEVADRVREECLATFGRSCELEAKLKTMKHGVTRYRINLACYRARWSPGGRVRLVAERMQWVSTEELSSIALSSTGRKIGNLLHALKT